MARGLLRRALTVILAGALLSGCATGNPSSQEPSPDGTTTASAGATARAPSAPRAPRQRRPVLDAEDGYAVTARRGVVEIHDAPRGRVVHALQNPRPTGAPLTFLLNRDRGDGWLRVLLPLRPNGQAGWVRRTDVTVTALPYRLEMSTGTHELSLWSGERLVRTFVAASGTGDTPTPLGTFYVTDLIEPTNPGYGPYAFGLSGFSEVLSDFGGGPGQIGLHGTDDPDSIGRSASHGCIRLSDADITTLAELLPLGTPVVIS